MLTINENYKTFNYIKIKNVYLSKNTIKRVKTTNWDTSWEKTIET